MGGDLEISSVLGKGATFSIVVPGVREVGENSWSSRKDVEEVGVQSSSWREDENHHMPEMTGEELVQAIRADSVLKALKVYLFTAEVEMKDANLEALKGLMS